MEIRNELEKYSNQLLSTQVLLNVLKSYKRPYDKIMDLLSKGILLQLRKGLYVLNSSHNNIQPEPFLIANHLYGPSYVSLDSALSYWGLIPEQVFEISSITIKNSKSFQIENKVYNYTRTSRRYYPLGIRSHLITNNQTILIASPEKALCDKIINTSGINLRSKKEAMQFLIEDLRLDKNHLLELNISEIKNWLSVCPKKNSIDQMIKSISEI